MLGTASRKNGRFIVMLMVTWSVTASLASAQLRYVDDGVEYAQPPSTSGQNLFGNERTIQQVQFQDLPPIVPGAVDEADTSGDLSSPSAGNGAAMGSEPGGAEDLPPAPIAYGDYMDEDVDGLTPIDEVWHEPFDPSIHDEAAFVYSTNSHFRRGFWYSQAEMVAMLRTELDDVPISADQSDTIIDGTPTNTNPATTNRPGITSKDMSPTYQPGVRLTLGRFLGQDFANRDHAVEFTFLGLFEYIDSASVVSDEPPGFLDTALGAFKSAIFQIGIVGNNNIPGFTGALEHTTVFRSDFNSYEMNFRVMGRPLRDRLALQPNGSWIRHGTPSHLRSFMVGLRAMTINEEFEYFSTFFDPTQDEGYYRVRTGNRLFGAQAGFELMENYSNWTIGLRFKGGALYNFADRQSFLNTLSFGNRDTRAEDLHRDNVAVLLEGGLVAAYQIRTNLVLRAGYDATYITGIASTIPNLGLDRAFPRFEVTGDAIYHGASLGVEMLW